MSAALLVPYIFQGGPRTQCTDGLWQTGYARLVYPDLILERTEEPANVWRVVYLDDVPYSRRVVLIMVSTTWGWRFGHISGLRGRPAQQRSQPMYWNYTLVETSLTMDQVAGVKEAIVSRLSKHFQHEAEGHWAQGIADDVLLGHGLPKLWMSLHFKWAARMQGPLPTQGPKTYEESQIVRAN